MASPVCLQDWLRVLAHHCEAIDPSFWMGPSSCSRTLVEHPASSHGCPACLLRAMSHFLGHCLLHERAPYLCFAGKIRVWALLTSGCVLCDHRCFGLLHSPMAICWYSSMHCHHNRLRVHPHSPGGHHHCKVATLDSDLDSVCLKREIKLLLLL